MMNYKSQASIAVVASMAIGLIVLVWMTAGDLDGRTGPQLAVAPASGILSGDDLTLYRTSGLAPIPILDSSTSDVREAVAFSNSTGGKSPSSRSSQAILTVPVQESRNVVNVARPIIVQASNDGPLDESEEFSVGPHTPDADHEQPLAPVAVRREPESTQSGTGQPVLRDPTSGIASTNLKQWPLPQSLINQLKHLAEHPYCRPWAVSVIGEVSRLHSIDTISAPEAGQSLTALRQMAKNAAELSQRCESLAQRTELLRAKYALARRLDVWEQAHALSARPVVLIERESSDPRVVISLLRDVDGKLRTLQHYSAWRDFLLLDKVHEIFTDGAYSDANRREIAQHVLLRLESPSLNETQFSFFESSEFARWRDALQEWAAEPINYATLLDHIEQHENGPSQNVARAVSYDSKVLGWSKDEAAQKLGQYVDTHYRNANIRIAVSEQLLSRYLPEPQQSTSRVNDVIGGASIRGTQSTTNRLILRLIPDRTQIRLGLEAHGHVQSDTGAYSGPVVFWNEGHTRFQARKLIMVDRLGLKVRFAEASAESDTRVRGLKTDYDGVPLIENLVRSTAMQEHRERSAQANREVEQKIESMARMRIDAEVHAKLAKAEADFNNNVLKPLQALQLNPEAIGLETTDERIIVRGRLAGDTQLAAYTPRPQAMSNSLLSIQLHDSALNNFVERLDLDGGQFDLQDLARQLTTKIGIKHKSFADELPPGITLRFVDEGAVRLDFVDNRVAITLRLAELSVGHNTTWKDFVVRAQYIPDVHGRDARFIRDPEGYIELAGKRLRLRDQIALRTIFTKVFSPNVSWSVIPDKIASDPKLQDLEVDQFVVSDGWIGVALAPGDPVEAANKRKQFGSRLRIFQ